MSQTQAGRVCFYLLEIFAQIASGLMVFLSQNHMGREGLEGNMASQGMTYPSKCDCLPLTIPVKDISMDFCPNTFLGD